MKNLARSNIMRVTPYKAGKPIEETKRELGLKEVIKLASNENPLGPSPKAVAAIKKCAGMVNRYPDSQSFYLKNKIASVMKLDPAEVVTGNGSDELIDIVIKAFVEEDENIVTADVTFLEYKILAYTAGREVITVPLKNFKFDLPAMRKKVNSKTKVVFIANPNNPTGTYCSAGEIREFIASLPEKCLVVLDEAYDTFIDVKDFPNSLGMFRKSNLIVLRTFSKAYGLAGLRVGYAVARQEIAGYMERSRQPFNVNLLAQAAAIAALDDRKFLRKSRAIVLEGKKYLYASLNSLGIGYVPTVSNFILIDLGRDGVQVFKELLKYGVIVRDMYQYGLKNFVRVTIGTKKENEKFVKALRKVLGKGAR